MTGQEPIARIIRARSGALVIAGVKNRPHQGDRNSQRYLPASSDGGERRTMWLAPLGGVLDAILGRATPRAAMRAVRIGPEAHIGWLSCYPGCHFYPARDR